MQVMGASLALAGVSGCRWHEDKLMPLARRPEGVVPGETRHYATAMELGRRRRPASCVTSYDGRPIKIDGNPAHPDESRRRKRPTIRRACSSCTIPIAADTVVQNSGGRTAVQLGRRSKSSRRRRSSALRAGIAASACACSRKRSSSPTLQRPQAKRSAQHCRRPSGSSTSPCRATTSVRRQRARVRQAAAHASRARPGERSCLASMPTSIAPELSRGPRQRARPDRATAFPTKGAMSRCLRGRELVRACSECIADHRLALRAEQIKAVRRRARRRDQRASAQPLPELGAAAGQAERAHS